MTVALLMSEDIHTVVSSFFVFSLCLSLLLAYGALQGFLSIVLGFPLCPHRPAESCDYPPCPCFIPISAAASYLPRLGLDAT